MLQIQSIPVGLEEFAATNFQPLPEPFLCLAVTALKCVDRRQGEMVNDGVFLAHHTVNSIQGLARELLSILETPLVDIYSGE